MRNIPKAVFLQIGEFHSIVDDFNELDEVTWSTESVDRDDAEYIHRDIHRKKVTKAYYEGAADREEHLREATEYLFTKEQVIELMERAWRASEIESNHSSRLPRTFCHWMDVVKPFGIK